MDLARQIGPLDSLAGAALPAPAAGAARRDRIGPARRGGGAACGARSRRGFRVSRITVRKALDGLVGEGLLIRRQGAGTFVAGRVEKQFSKLTSFSEDMAARGRTPRSEWLSKVESAVTPTNR